jgi:4-hydroxybenzoyl-CoA thioesterase
MLINRRTIRIELETAIPQVSCSTQGILSGSMHCAAALFEAAGFLRGDLVARQGMVIPMVDTRSRVLTPFRFGDELTVETAITRFGRSSFDVQHRILKGADLAVECSETGCRPESISLLKRG